MHEGAVHLKCIKEATLIASGAGCCLSRQMAWCPSPGCEHAVEARAEVGSDPMDITCRCGATFCFQCKEEAHRPVRPSISVNCCHTPYLKYIVVEA